MRLFTKTSMPLVIGIIGKGVEVAEDVKGVEVLEAIEGREVEELRS